MKLLQPIRDFIESRDKKDLNKYLIGAVGAVICLIVLIVWWRYYSIWSINEMIADINNQREEVQHILTKHKYLIKEEKELNELLGKNPDFTILAYSTELLNKFRLKSSTPLEISAGVGTDTYAEIIANIEIVDTDMQTMAQLFQEIEKEKRVSIKSIQIMRAKPTTVNVRLEIATLRKKV